MKNRLYCKFLAVGIIVLFVGVSVNPAFAFRSSEETRFEVSEFNDDKTEVIVDFYGIKDVETNTFYLDNEEIKKLDSIIYDFKNSLNTTVSMEESECILNNTLDNLTGLGLIDGEAVRDTFRISKKIFENIGYKFDDEPFIKSDMKIMFFVLISLQADYANFMPSYVAFLYRIYSNYDYYEKNHPLLVQICDSILNTLANIAVSLIKHFGGGFAGVLAFMLLCFLWYYFNPFPIGYSVSLSYSNMNNHGWVTAVGFLGVQIIEGEYRGALAGFTGLRIFYNSDFYMIGFALGSALEEVNDEFRIK